MADTKKEEGEVDNGKCDKKEESKGTKEKKKSKRNLPNPHKKFKKEWKKPAYHEKSIQWSTKLCVRPNVTVQQIKVDEEKKQKRIQKKNALCYVISHSSKYC